MDFNQINKLVSIQETDSTNNYANRQLAEGEVSDGTVFLAHSQTTGRGQANNAWESAPGKNLTFSMVLKPEFLGIMDQFMLSKVVTLGICNVFKLYVDGVKIKWPNDIYIGARKIGGILIENSIMSGKITSSVVGVGLNINQEKFVSNAPNPVSLKQLTGNDYELPLLLDQIISEINTFYQKLKTGDFSEINQLFENRMYLFGESHRYLTDGKLFVGRIIGVNGIGQLMIRDENEKLRSFHFKEVEFVFQ